VTSLGSPAPKCEVKLECPSAPGCSFGDGPTFSGLTDENGTVRPDHFVTDRPGSYFIRVSASHAEVDPTKIPATNVPGFCSKKLVCIVLAVVAAGASVGIKLATSRSGNTNATSVAPPLSVSVSFGTPTIKAP
jgi:hypothetical protein